MSNAAGDSKHIGPAGDAPRGGVATVTSNKDLKYVLALDVGTTTIRAHVYDQTTTIRGSGNRKVGCRQII